MRQTVAEARPTPTAGGEKTKEAAGLDWKVLRGGKTEKDVYSGTV